MKPKEPINCGQQNLFRSRLDRIIDANHEFVVVARNVNWNYLSEECGNSYSDKPGHPALPTRQMAGLHQPKYTGNRSDKEVVAM